MKWKAACKGDWRKTHRFLLWPKYLRGEWRWLERAWILQQYIVWGLGPEWGYRGEPSGEWMDIDWWFSDVELPEGGAGSRTPSQREWDNRLRFGVVTSKHHWLTQDDIVELEEAGQFDWRCKKLLDFGADWREYRRLGRAFLDEFQDPIAHLTDKEPSYYCAFCKAQGENRFAVQHDEDCVWTQWQIALEKTGG